MSNKKTLLNENTIRRFMKLASIAPLTETFVDKIKEEEEVVEESNEETVTEGEEETINEEVEEVTEGAHEEEEELEEMAHPPAGRDDDEEEMEEGMHPTMDRDDDMGGDEDLGDALTDMMQAIAKAVEDVAASHGVDLAMDVDAEDDAPAMDDEPAMDDMGDEPMDDMDMEKDDMEPMEEETVEEEVVEEDNGEDDLLEKITQKVAARLQQEQEINEEEEATPEVDPVAIKEAKLNKLTDIIVERIFSSLKK